MSKPSSKVRSGISYRAKLLLKQAYQNNCFISNVTVRTAQTASEELLDAGMMCFGEYNSANGYKLTVLGKREAAKLEAQEAELSN